MWLVGAITKEELEQVRLQKNKWDIQVITGEGINKMLDPDFDPAIYEPDDDDDLYICVFIDNDITHHEWEVRWDDAERAYLLCLIYIDRSDRMVDSG